jgi:hypothetical protein
MNRLYRTPYPNYSLKTEDAIRQTFSANISAHSRPATEIIVRLTAASSLLR